MGGFCTRAEADASSYNVDSTNILDHYKLGDTLGRGAFGVVKAAVLKPHALGALDHALDTGTVGKQVQRRQRFASRPLAVKVMRHEHSSSDGDSCERLEVQISRLEVQIQDLQRGMDANNLSQFEELQWLNEYSENLKSKLADKRRKQTKKTPREMMLREVLLLEKCEHRFIMQLVETFEDSNLFCVVFERCYGSVVSRYPEGVLITKAVATQGHQLLSAVTYLHEILILHRDIKPENLMFRTPNQDSEVLLGDFGMAVELRKVEDRCQGCAGTPHFVPPEGFHSYYQSFASDVWACGCTIYWMLLGQCPFEVTQEDLGKHQVDGKSQANHGKSMQTTAIFNMWRSTRMGKVLNGWKPQFEHDQTAMLARKICHPRENPAFTYQNGQQLDDNLIIDLITKMLWKQPKYRIAADEALKHPWIAGAKEEAEKGSCNWTATPGALPSAPPARQDSTMSKTTGNKVRLDRVVPCPSETATGVLE